MIDYQIQDKFQFQYSSMSGYTEELYNKIIDNRMTSDFAVQEILAEAERPFFKRNDDESAPVGWWRGEFWGKWIISAVRACKYKKNEKLEGIIRNSVEKIMATADENGYIGTYQNPALILPCSKDEGVKAVGFRCDFCWNIWCQKYTLWGLIEAYELFGDKKMLESAEKHANQLIDTVHKTGVNPCETGTFYGVASGSIMKPMLKLYRHTGNQKLLDFAFSIADGFEDDETKCIKIIKNSLAGLPVHLWNYKNPMAAAKRRFDNQKAYEMMSCFEGICELYRLTGIEKYFTASKKFYDLLIDYEYNRLMSVGYNDRFLFAASIEDAVTELCDIIHYMRITEDLFKLTGDTKYLDHYENAFLNPFLGSIMRDGSYGSRATRSMSHHITEYNVVGMKYNQCCVNNMPRTFESTAKLITAKNMDGFFVNLYIPSEAEIDGTKIKIGDGYTQYCATSIEIESEKPQKIYFRIPSWSEHTTILCKDETHKPECGRFYPITVEAGKTIVDMQFDQTPRILYADYPRDMFPMTPFMKKRYDLEMPAEVTNDNKATICIGPMLLAMTTQLGTSWEVMTQRPTVNGLVKKCKATPIAKDGMLCCYDVTFYTKNSEETIPMCDFASASNRFIPEDFSIFV